MKKKRFPFLIFAIWLVLFLAIGIKIVRNMDSRSENERVQSEDSEGGLAVKPEDVSEKESDKDSKKEQKKIIKAVRALTE